jgi:protein-tyrosine phosphatase
MVSHNMVHVIASDSHSPQNRISLLSDTCNRILSKYGENLANKLLIENPKNILEGNEIICDEHCRIEKRLFWRI